MPKNAGYGFLATLALTISFSGIILIFLLTFYAQTTTQWNPSWRKPLIGTIFALICLSGILAVFFPEKCSKPFHIRIKEKTVYEAKNSNSSRASVHFEGHHPNCGKFKAHVITANGLVLCAACTGLLAGGLIALPLNVFYFFFGLDFLGQFGLWNVLFGQVGVVLGFFQFKLSGFVRSIFNTVFVIACFFVLAGVDSLAENVLIDLYLTGLIVFWIYTRIILSRWDHSRICCTCTAFCELK
ncbi:hypothetical protein KEJ45_04140 [Candidatus Bathyarchaeota archaeon]|nr:hypothetical protein [Candidatus Bathyarchaeota archaeon]